MPENNYDQENEDQQNINSKTWQDSSGTGDNNGEGNNNQSLSNITQDSEDIPQLSKTEKETLDKKRNAPEFQQGLNKILPSDDGNNDENAKNVNLSQLIKQWQNDNKENGSEEEAPKENKTGLPDELKTGMEALSGISLDDVNVYYNSSLPAQFQAHAFAQGTDIHIGPGQKQHLAHEAWHVVQQKQGRVKATMQMKGNVEINDDQKLETEADVMGAKAMKLNVNNNEVQQFKSKSDVIQRHVMMASDATDSMDLEELKNKGIVHFKMIKNPHDFWENKEKEWASIKTKDQQRAANMTNKIAAVKADLIKSGQNGNAVAQMVTSVLEKFSVDFIPVTKVSVTELWTFCELTTKRGAVMTTKDYDEESKKLQANPIWFNGTTVSVANQRKNAFPEGVAGMYSTGGNIEICTDAYEQYGIQLIRANMIHEATHLEQFSRWLETNKEFIAKKLGKAPNTLTNEELYKSVLNTKGHADSPYSEYLNFFNNGVNQFKKEFEAYWNQALFGQGKNDTTKWSSDPEARKQQIKNKILTGPGAKAYTYAVDAYNTDKGKAEIDAYADKFVEENKETQDKTFLGSKSVFGKKIGTKERAKHQEKNRKKEALY